MLMLDEGCHGRWMPRYHAPSGPLACWPAARHHHEMAEPTEFEPASFAGEWAAAWNRRDIESVLAHFSEDTVFTSPTALAVTGAAVVSGKTALRAYWNLAMAKISSLHFTVDRVLWDASQAELAIIYIAAINGASKRVSENLVFGADGKVVAAEVFHGAPL